MATPMFAIVECHAPIGTHFDSDATVVERILVHDDGVGHETTRFAMFESRLDDVAAHRCNPTDGAHLHHGVRVGICARRLGEFNALTLRDYLHAACR